MNAKKNKSVNAENRTQLYFLLGLNISLLCILVVLESSRKYEEEKVVIEEPVIPLEENEVLVLSREETPPIDISESPQISTDIPVDIVVVDNCDLNFNSDIFPMDKPNIRVSNTESKKTKPTFPIVEGVGPTIINNTVDQRIINRTQVKQAMIYPGCEAYEGNNRMLFQCFNKKLKNDIEKHLDPFFKEKGSEKERISIAFIIDEKGKLHLKEYNDKHISKELKINALQAFETLAKRMNAKAEKGKGIKAATNKANQPAKLEYTIPINFEANE